MQAPADVVHPPNLPRLLEASRSRRHTFGEAAVRRRVPLTGFPSGRRAFLHCRTGAVAG